MAAYYTDQILTYMGNKRKVLPHIEEIVEHIKGALGGKDKLTIGDGFAGSGVVSRLFKKHASALYANDLAGYSHTLNQCYLANPDDATLAHIQRLIAAGNAFVNSGAPGQDPPFIQRYWAPQSDVAIQEGERVYFTQENARRIDCYQEYIRRHVPPGYRPFLLAPLLVQASVHNNCSGNFAAFYKKDAVGHYGGKHENDLKRITQPIELPPLPLFCVNACQVHVTQQDVQEWAATQEMPALDLVYYDPPYNKHPYHIYYFLLDIINTWDTQMAVPATFRGQPKKWRASAFNSISKARVAFDQLIRHTRAKYILVSYNNEGIIPEKDIKAILSQYGTVTEKIITHSTYNRMKGIAEYKKSADKAAQPKIKECLYLLKTAF
jgi:adenine-specific DNA-methyltransferase